MNEKTEEKELKKNRRISVYFITPKQAERLQD